MFLCRWVYASINFISFGGACCQRNKLFDASVDKKWRTLRQIRDSLLSKCTNTAAQLSLITNSRRKSFKFLKSFLHPSSKSFKSFPKSGIAISWLFDLMKNSGDALLVLIIFVSAELLLWSIKKLKIHWCFVRLVEGEFKGCWKMDEFMFLISLNGEPFGRTWWPVEAFLCCNITLAMNSYQKSRHETSDRSLRVLKSK